MMLAETLLTAEKSASWWVDPWWKWIQCLSTSKPPGNLPEIGTGPFVVDVVSTPEAGMLCLSIGQVLST